MTRYHFHNIRTGQRVTGELQGSWGTNVPQAAIECEVGRVERGEARPRTRFPEPRPGWVTVYPAGTEDLPFGHPGRQVEIPLDGLRVEPVGFGPGAIRMCAWCRRVHRNGVWEVVHPEPVANVTHGICEDCAAKIEAEMDAEDAAAGTECATGSR